MEKLHRYAPTKGDKEKNREKREKKDVPKMNQREKERGRKEKESKVRKREKREKRKKSENMSPRCTQDVIGRNYRYIRRNAQNLKKLPRTSSSTLSL